MNRVNNRFLVMVAAVLLVATIATGAQLPALFICAFGAGAITIVTFMGVRSMRRGPGPMPRGREALRFEALRFAVRPQATRAAVKAAVDKALTK